MKTMIKNKGILFSALASVMMMTACNSEEDVFYDESNEPTGIEIYATGAYGAGNNPQSRMSYEDNLETNHMNLAWSEKDAFSAFINGKYGKYDFKIEAPRNGETYTASETFKCKKFSSFVTDGTTVDAIYPSVTEGFMYWVDPTSIDLPLAVQKQEGNGSTDHLKKYDYMVGHAKYSSSTPDSLNFNFKDSGDGKSGRLASIYRINMDLSCAVTSVSKIVITCKNAKKRSSLVTSEKVNITNGKVFGEVMGKVTLHIAKGEVKNGKFVAYVMLFPSAVKERTITVTVKEGTTEKTFTDTKIYNEEVNYTRGQFKYINLNLKPNNFKPEYTNDDFKMWNINYCKNASSQEDMKKYLGAGVYWDNGSEGDHQQTYTVTNKKGQTGTYHAGLWVKKMCYIDSNITPASKVSVEDNTMKVGRPEKIDEYFFLPAVGKDFTNTGSLGCYWSGSYQILMGAPLNSYYLEFNKNMARVNKFYLFNPENVFNLPMFSE